MPRLLLRCLLRCLLVCLALLACGPARAQSALVAQRYAKAEYDVPMRDGVKLHTTVYTPRDAAPERRYPFLVKRTPYGCGPYGDRFPGRIGPSRYAEADGYVFVCQDVRGRWMSEGVYDNMRPHVPGDAAVDESADTYDTIAWLLASVPHHNGKVGQWGISYPGFYTAAALPEAHPALVAASPQAPIADFFFDDFHHHGAYLLSYWRVTPLFGHQKAGPTDEAWYRFVDPGTPDGYRFYLEMGPLKNARQWYGPDNVFWTQLTEHPNYDAFWQARNLLPHLKDVRTNVLTVGGLFDAEDLYGPLHVYRAVEASSPGVFNALVMGPWGHGDWADTSRVQQVGNLDFGEGISDFFQRDVEAPFFRHFLKGEGAPPAFEALLFDTGRKAWQAFDRWPPRGARRVRYYLRAGEGLAATPPEAGEAAFTEYVSDPAEPVPDNDVVELVFTPRTYMTADQRFASRRPDVIAFETEVLREDVTLAGDLLAHLMVSTTGTDADFVVKLVDVYPPGEPNTAYTPRHVRLGGYEQMVRSDVMRGRFRTSYEHPAPFTPGEVTRIDLPLQDVYHTFKRGHRLMVQVQSTWFPLIDRNPQTFVPNIFEADAADFVRATHRVYHAPGQESYLEVKVVEGGRAGGP